MARLDIKRIFKLSWERAKATEEIADDDPVVEHVEGNVIRAIAELEVARLKRAEPIPISYAQTEAGQQSSADAKSEDDPTISAVA